MAVGQAVLVLTPRAASTQEVNAAIAHLAAEVGSLSLHKALQAGSIP